MRSRAAALAAAPWGWLSVADKEDTRSQLLQEACARKGIELQILDYRDVLARRLRGEALPDIAADQIIRIESPGRSPEVNAGLLQLGRTDCEANGLLCLDDRDIAAALADEGRIACPRQWYAGFTNLLGQMQRHWPAATLYSSHPADIGILFDKTACHARLQESGIAVPESPGGVCSFAELEAAMGEHRMQQVFVKLAHGSAASGVVALRLGAGRAKAWTTVEAVELGGSTLLYNSRRVREIADVGRIAAVIDALCPHRVHVERWIPKAGFAGKSFDIRVLVIAGEPAHMVVRLARNPITNLHLLNQRLDIATIRPRIADAPWLAMLATCRRVAALFPRSLHLGLDIAFDPNLLDHRVLEVNAFGDHINGLLHAGRTTHETEIDAVTDLLPHLRGAVGTWLRPQRGSP